MPTPVDDLVTTAEACLLLGKHPSTLSRWVREDKLTPVKKVRGLRGPMLFAREDIERLADAA
jgi:predicted site-specific integrase-resolvase